MLTFTSVAWRKLAVVRIGYRLVSAPARTELRTGFTPVTTIGDGLLVVCLIYSSKRITVDVKAKKKIHLLATLGFSAVHARVTFWTECTAALTIAIAGEFDIHAIVVAIFPASCTAAVATDPSRHVNEASYKQGNQKQFHCATRPQHKLVPIPLPVRTSKGGLGAASYSGYFLWLR